MSKKQSVLKRAKFNVRHYNDIGIALDIAYTDTSQPKHKRSYLAAQKALDRLWRIAKEIKVQSIDD